MICVVERSHDHQPFARRDVSAKGAVCVRADVEPFVLSLVVKQEVVGNAVSGRVGQRSRNEIGVLQRHFEGLVNGVQSDSQSVKELLPDQVVVGGVFVGRRCSVERQVVAAGSERDRDDTGFGVILRREVQCVLAFVDRVQAERRCCHRSVLKRAVLSRVEEDVHQHVHHVRLGGEFHHRQGLRADVGNGQAVHGAYVKAIIRDADVPCSVGEVEGKLSQFVGGCSPFKAVLVGSNNFGGFPAW